MKRFLRNYRLSVPAGILALTVLAWLLFGYFAVQKLFIDDTVSEAAPTFDAPAAAPAAPATTIVTEANGSFVSREHDTSGTATVLGDGSGQRFLRFENFATSNGPDLNVYLVNSRAGGVNDYIDLGNLKGNIGDQNYEVPVGTDLAVYDTVIVWCVRFSANFGDAVLVPV